MSLLGEDHSNHGSTDSSDISEGDFKPGAYAAKLQLRKSEERKKEREKTIEGTGVRESLDSIYRVSGPEE